MDTIDKIKSDSFKHVLDHFMGGLPEYDDALVLFKGVQINGVDLYSFITNPTEKEYNTLIEYLDSTIAELDKSITLYDKTGLHRPCIKFELFKSKLEGYKMSLTVSWRYWKLCVKERESKSA